MGQHRQHRRGNAFLKPILLGSVGGSLGALGALLTLALTLVETLIRPRKRTIFDRSTLTPYELGLPGEAVGFAPQQGDYQVSGWYIPHPEATTTVLLCPGYHGKAADVLSLAAPLWKAGHTVLAFE